MEGWQKDILRRHRVAILNDLYIDNVVDDLIAKDVLQPEHMDRINGQVTQKDKARQLLNLLPSLGPKAYPEFINSLREPYPWLYELLGKESKNTSTNIDVISPSISSIEVNKLNKSAMLLQDMCHLLSTLSSVSSACGTSLCAIGDSLAVLVQTVKVVENLPSVVSGVSRKNSINKSMVVQNSNLNFGSSAEVLATEENERVEADVSQEKGNICKGNIPIMDTREEEWSGKILADVYKKQQDKVSDVFVAESHESLVLNGFTDTSPVSGVPINSPDSGIVAEDMEHLSIISSNEKKTFDKSEGITSEMGNDEPDGCFNDLSANSTGDTNISFDVLHMKMKPLIDDVERLQHSIMDISMALKSVVKVSDSTLKIASSVSN